MNRRLPLAMLASLGLTAAALADTPVRQVNIDVRFLEVTTDSLRDLGADIGFGGGVSFNYAASERAPVIGFIGVGWDRLAGSDQFKIEMFGFQVGARFRLTPNKPLSDSQTSLVLIAGHYDNKHEDSEGDGSRKGEGFDFGIEVGPAMGGRGPLWRFLYSNRPDTFRKRTQLVIIQAGFPIKVD